MPDEEPKTTEAVKPVEEVKPPETEAPKPEAVIVEPQKETNPLETRIEAIERQLRERDEKEKIAAAQSKEVKHGEVQEKESGRGDERDPVLPKAKADEGVGGTAGGDESKGVPQQPVKRGHRFKFKSRKPVKS